MGKDALVAFAIDDRLVGIARRLSAPLQSDARIIFPQMLLARHAFYGGALLVPHGRDVEKHVRRPSALFRLMRLKKKKRRRAAHPLARPVAARLRGGPRA